MATLRLMIPPPTMSKRAVPKVNPRIAVFNMVPASAGILRESFKQFNIDTVELSPEDFRQRLVREKFEGCAVHIDESAQEFLDTLRSSPSNKRVVLIGITPDFRRAVPFAKYGFNAIFDEPLDRHKIRKSLGSTRNLMLHELRRYVRIPIVTPVSLQLGRQPLSCWSQEISLGGMSLRDAALLQVGDYVKVSFTLPGADIVVSSGEICWAKDGDFRGVRFHTDPVSTVLLKRWVDDYLDLR